MTPCDKQMAASRKIDRLGSGLREAFSRAYRRYERSLRI